MTDEPVEPVPVCAVCGRASDDDVCGPCRRAGYRAPTLFDDDEGGG